LKNHNIKCLFGIHDWKVYVLSQDIHGNIHEEYICDRCGKVREINYKI